MAFDSAFYENEPQAQSDCDFGNHTDDSSVYQFVGTEEAVQQYLKETVLAEYSAPLLRSVFDLKASFECFLNKYYFVEQLRRMLVTEGCLYLSGAFVMALGITILFGGQILTTVLGQAFFFYIKVTELPTMVLLPVLL